MDKKVSKAGKYMSLLLRHAPEKENLVMDKNGYVLTKQLLKEKYTIESKDFQFTKDGKYIRTHSYNFTQICVPSL